MASGCLERVLKYSKETYQDGGHHGWIAVLGLFTCCVAWIGMLKGLGMMLPTLQEQFVTSTWLIGWMVAFVEAGAAISGKFKNISMNSKDNNNNNDDLYKIF